MNEQISAQFRTEGTPAFPVESPESDNSAASPAETTDTTQTQSQEGEQAPAESQAGGEEGGKDRGFADDPRWQERESDWKTRFNEQETRHTDELKKLNESIPNLIANALKEAGVSKDAPTAPASVTPQQIPSWFGGDEQQWAEFQGWNNTLIAQAEDRGAQKAQKAIEDKSTAEQKAIEDATNYMNSEIGVIESDKTINPQGVKVDRNKLLKFTIDNDLVDSNGRWNYKAAFRLMQGVNAPAPANQDRKKIAAETTSDNRPEVRPDPIVTSSDFSKPGARPW